MVHSPAVAGNGFWQRVQSPITHYMGLTALGQDFGPLNYFHLHPCDDQAGFKRKKSLGFVKALGLTRVTNGHALHPSIRKTNLCSENKYVEIAEILQKIYFGGHFFLNQVFSVGSTIHPPNRIENGLCRCRGGYI